MSQPDNGCCRRIRTAIRLFTRRDAPKIERQLFFSALPKTPPKRSDDIMDIILQLIVFLLEYLKPDDDNDDNNDHTNFPALAEISRTTALKHVDTQVLKRSALTLANQIDSTIREIHNNPSFSLRVARETIRKNNHTTLGSFAHAWADWNHIIRSVMDEFNDNQRLDTITQHLDAWTQIAKGLKTLL